MQTIACFILLAATAFGLGRLCLWRVRFMRAAETWVFSSACGLALLAYLTLLLGAIGWMSPRGVFTLFGACALAGFPVFARFVGRLPWRSFRPQPLAIVCLSVLVGAAVINLGAASHPILEIDSWEYHLPVPKAWMTEGRIFAVPYSLQANYHFLTEMLNVVAFAISENDVILCKMTQWYSGILLAVATWCFARSFFSARVAWIAATITYLGPDISWISATAYIDLTVGLFVWLGVFSMVRAARLRGYGWHIVAGLFFGFAFSAKQSGAILAVIAYLGYGAALLFESNRRHKLGRWFAAAAPAGLIAFALGTPWMVKNYIFTNDPLYPSFVGAFDVPAEYTLPASGFANYYSGLKNLTHWNAETLGWLTHALVNFSRNIWYDAANLLVVWLAIGVLIVILFRCRVSPALRILLATGLIAAPWFALVESRFLIGLFPIYLLILVQTLSTATYRKRWLFAVTALCLLFFYARSFLVYNFKVREHTRFYYTFGPILSKRGQREWLEENSVGHAIVERLNRTLRRRDRLLACGSFSALPRIDVPFLLNVPVPFLADPDRPGQPMPATRNNLLWFLWERFGDRAAIHAWLRKERITHILMTPGAARELNAHSGFVDAYLQELYGDLMVTLYRLRSSPVGEGSD